MPPLSQFTIAPIPKFLVGKPANWPMPTEKFKAWTKEEETQIRQILSKLPKTLTHVGEIKFHRSIEKSSNFFFFRKNR